MDLFNLHHIYLNQPLHSKKSAFERIAEIAVDLKLADSKQPIVDGLLNREQQGTTGFLDGFAIPHTKSSAIQKPGVVILTSTDGIEWEALDGAPVTFLIALLIPESEAGTTHLTLLSHISRMLIHADVRQRLLQAQAPEEIFETFQQALVNA
jgi:fructose PTS system EIIA component